MKYLFYIDLKTVSCDPKTIENLLEENSNSYLKISENLWALNIPKHQFNNVYTSVPTYYLDVLLGDYLEENSICIMQEINEDTKQDYNLPESAIQFLFDEAESS